MDKIWDFLWFNRSFNDTFTLLLFWLPLIANVIAYSIRVYQRTQADKAAIRGELKYHSDWLKVGHLVGYLAASVIPLVNLCFFIFDTMGELWKMAWKKFGWFFNIRLVSGKPPGDTTA